MWGENPGNQGVGGEESEIDALKNFKTDQWNLIFKYKLLFSKWFWIEGTKSKTYTTKVVGSLWIKPADI